MTLESFPWLDLLTELAGTVLALALVALALCGLLVIAGA